MNLGQFEQISPVHANNGFKSISELNNCCQYNQSVIGTVDISGGKNWAIDNETIVFKYDGSSNYTATLVANCANLAAVKAEVQAKLNAQITGLTVDDDGSNHITISCADGHYFELVSGDGLTTLGLTAAYYGDKYWKTYSTSTGTDGQYIVSIPTYSMNVAQTTERIYTPGVLLNAYNGVSRSWGDRVCFLCASEYNISGQNKHSFTFSYSTDGGIAWTDAVVGYTSGVKIQTDNIIKFTDNSLFISGMYRTNTVNTNIAFYNSALTKITSVDIYITVNSYEMFYKGSYDPDTDRYYFIYKNTAGDLKLAYFNKTTITDVETLTITEPAVWDSSQQFYYKRGAYEYTIDQDHFYQRFDGGDWVSIPGSGQSQTGIVWTYDVNGNYIVKYIIWKDAIYTMSPTGGILKIQEIDVTSARIGIDDWFNDVSNGYIYEYIPNSLSVPTSECEFRGGYVLEHTASFKTTYTGFFDDQYLEPETGMGMLVRDFKDYEEVECVSVIEQDLERTFSADFIAQRTDQMIDYVCKNKCQYLWLKTSDAGTAGTFTRSYKNCKVRLFLQEMDQLEARQSVINTDYGICYTATPVASNITLSAANGVFSEFKPTSRKYTVAEVIVKGMTSTVRRSNAIGSGSIIIYMPNVSSTTELQTIADNNLAETSIQIISCTVNTTDTGYLQWGQSFTIVNANETPAINGTYYLYETTRYSPTTHIQECIFYNRVHIQQGPQKALQNQVNYIEQKMDNILNTDLNNYCVVKNSANITIVHSDWRALSFDTDIKDPSGLHATGAGNDDIIIKKAGLYLVGFHISFNVTAHAHETFVKLRLNSNEVAHGISNGSANYYPPATAVIPLVLAVDDVLDLQAYAFTSNDQMLKDYSYFWVKYVGP